MNSRSNDDHLPPEARRNLRKMVPEDDEPGGGLTLAKSQVGVVFVDEKGSCIGLPYSSLLSVEPKGSDLLATFTTHTVTLTGYGLTAPVQNSLLMYLTLHKRDLVQALPGGRDRDFGQAKPVVTAICWEAVKE